MNSIFSEKQLLLNQKCEKHGINCDALNIDPQSNQNRICLLCVKDQRIPYEQIVSIQQLLDLNSTAFMPLYPLVMDENLKKWNEFGPKLESILSKVKQRFSTLQSNMIKQIEIMIEKESKRVENLINEFKSNQSSLQKLTSIKQIQDILLRKDSNKDNTLHYYIVQHCTESPKQIDLIQKKFIEIEAQQRLFSTEGFEKIEQEIFSLIKKIDFFFSSISNNGDLSQNNRNQDCLSNNNNHNNNNNNNSKDLIRKQNIQSIDFNDHQNFFTPRQQTSEQNSTQNLIWNQQNFFTPRQQASEQKSTQNFKWNQQNIQNYEIKSIQNQTNIPQVIESSDKFLFKDCQNLKASVKLSSSRIVVQESHEQQQQIPFCHPLKESYLRQINLPSNRVRSNQSQPNQVQMKLSESIILIQQSDEQQNIVFSNLSNTQQSNQEQDKLSSSRINFKQAKEEQQNLLSSLPSSKQFSQQKNNENDYKQDRFIQSEQCQVIDPSNQYSSRNKQPEILKESNLNKFESISNNPQHKKCKHQSPARTVCTKCQSIKPREIKQQDFWICQCGIQHRF